MTGPSGRERTGPSGRERTGPSGRERTVRRRVVSVLALALGTGLVLGRPAPARPVAPVRGAGGPVAAPAGALSSAWFCAGATDSPVGLAPGRLVLTNAGPRWVTASVTVVAGAGRSAHRSVVIGPGRRQIVPETVPETAAWTGAIVALNGGAVTVEQEIDGPLGTTVTPCATNGSDAWYFAAGATLVNATSEISLLNPYPAPAIADLTFTTEKGPEAPPQWQGLIVPAGRLVAVDLGAELLRRSAIATTVTVTSGRLVAWKTDVVSRPLFGTPLLGTGAAAGAATDRASPVVGVTAVLGAPAPAVTWRWPEGSSAAAVGERYRIYDPGPHPARLVLRFSGPSGGGMSRPVTVGSEAVATLDPQALGIPAGTAYSATLRSTNGVPVVAERTVSEAPGATGGGGTGEMLGAVQTAPDWLVASPDGPADEVIAVSNPGPVPLTVALEALSGGALVALPAGGAGSRGQWRVPGGGRVSVALGAAAGWADGVLVHATGPVVVARDLSGTQGAPGVSVALGVPVGV